jgi:hypothetical protein
MSSFALRNLNDDKETSIPPECIVDRHLDLSCEFIKTTFCGNLEADTISIDKDGYQRPLISKMYKNISNEEQFVLVERDQHGNFVYDDRYNSCFKAEIDGFSF